MTKMKKRKIYLAHNFWRFCSILDWQGGMAKGQLFMAVTNDKSKRTKQGRIWREDSLGPSYCMQDAPTWDSTHDPSIGS